MPSGVRTTSWPWGPIQRRRSGIEILWTLLYFVLGLVETILAYYAFSRADDHAYFLQVANHGLQAVPDFSQPFLNLKTNAAAMSFYLITTPSRLLGGLELVHLLWLRLLTLFGFLVAFNWFQRTVSPELSEKARSANRHTFIMLILLYPGQLAWTASLLRDGAATSMFFFGLACFRPSWTVIPAMAFLAAAFAMRPEYLLILLLVLFVLSLRNAVAAIKYRIVVLLSLLLLFSIATHPIQLASAEFAQLAYGEANSAFPLVRSAFDLRGYFLVLCQALIDPIPLGNPHQATFFDLSEAAFFSYLLWRSKTLLRDNRPNVAALTAALMCGLWIFAYFETFVGAFSRHRLFLEASLIALLSAAQMDFGTPRLKTRLLKKRRNAQSGQTSLLVSGDADNQTHF